MKLYLVERKDKPEWDECIKAVVSASSEERASQVLPQYAEVCYWYRANLTVTEIGISNSDKETVILAEYSWA